MKSKVIVNLVRQIGRNSLFKQGAPKFCWICGRKFWGNKVYTVIFKDYGLHYVHKSCAEGETNEIS